MPTVTHSFIFQCFDFNKFVGYANEEEMVNGGLELMEQNLLWGGMSLVCIICVASNMHLLKNKMFLTFF